MSRTNDFKEYDLPAYLKTDIDKLNKCINEDNGRDFDIHWMDLSSSINSAQYDEEISIGLADEIRKEWL